MSDHHDGDGWQDEVDLRARLAAAEAEAADLRRQARAWEESYIFSTANNTALAVKLYGSDDVDDPGLVERCATAERQWDAAERELADLRAQLAVATTAATAGEAEASTLRCAGVDLCAHLERIVTGDAKLAEYIGQCVVHYRAIVGAYGPDVGEGEV